MDISSIAEKLQARLTGFNHTMKVDFEGDGYVHVDATQNPPFASFEDKDAEVTLVTSIETFSKILSGDQDPNIAFMMGRLKVQGSMGLALKLNAMLEE
jgi:putative sterol carrier protein